MISSSTAAASCRVNGDADPLFQRLDALHGARQIVVALPMDQKDIGPGRQRIHRQRCRDSKSSDGLQAAGASLRRSELMIGGAHRKIGHEMSVHDVHVDAVRAGALGLRDLIAQTREIGRQDRWSELHCIVRHVAPLSLR